MNGAARRRAPVASKIAGVVLNNAMEGLPYYYDYRYYGYKERRVSGLAPGASEGSGPSAAPGAHETEGEP